MTALNLRDAIPIVRALRKRDGGLTAEQNEALFTLSIAAIGLRDLYDEHDLDEEDASGSAADQCASLYEVFNSVGLPVS